MSEHENLRIAREAFEAWNAHDPDRLNALLADEFLSESDCAELREHLVPRSGDPIRGLPQRPQCG